jgi:hypothetical protein
MEERDRLQRNKSQQQPRQNTKAKERSIVQEAEIKRLGAFGRVALPGDGTAFLLDSSGTRGKKQAADTEEKGRRGS